MSSAGKQVVDQATIVDPNSIVIAENVELAEDKNLDIFRLIHQRKYEDLKTIDPKRFDCKMSLKDLNEKLKLGLNNSRDGESLTPLDFALDSVSFEIERMRLKCQKEESAIKVTINIESLCKNKIFANVNYEYECEDVKSEINKITDTEVKSLIEFYSEGDDDAQLIRDKFTEIELSKPSEKFREFYMLFFKSKGELKKISNVIFLLCSHTPNFREILSKYKSTQFEHIKEVLSEISSKYALHIDLILLVDLRNQSDKFDAKKQEISAEIQKIGKFRFNDVYNKSMLTATYPTTQKTPKEFADENGLSDLFIQKTDQVPKKWGLFGKGGSKKRKTNKQKSKKRNAKKNKSKRRV